MTKGVQVVVGEFELLEGHELTAPVRTGGWRVRMDVEPPGHRGLCLSRYRPVRPSKTQHNEKSDAVTQKVTMVCLTEAPLPRAPSGAAGLRCRRLHKAWLVL